MRKSNIQKNHKVAHNPETKKKELNTKLNNNLQKYSTKQCSWNKIQANR